MGLSDFHEIRFICFTAPSTAEPAPSSEIEELAWFTTADAEACAPAVRFLLGRLRADSLID